MNHNIPCCNSNGQCVTRKCQLVLNSTRIKNSISRFTVTLRSNLSFWLRATWRDCWECCCRIADVRMKNVLHPGRYQPIRTSGNLPLATRSVHVSSNCSVSRFPKQTALLSQRRIYLLFWQGMALISLKSIFRTNNRLNNNLVLTERQSGYSISRVDAMKRLKTSIWSVFLNIRGLA